MFTLIERAGAARAQINVVQNRSEELKQNVLPG
jgi:hypothetical protein